MNDHLNKIPQETSLTPDTQTTGDAPSGENVRDHPRDRAVLNASKPLPEEVGDMRRSLNLAIREMGRIQQSLARIESLVASRETPAEKPIQWDTFSKTLVEIKERVTREAISSARERREIRRVAIDLQKQFEALQQGNRLSSRADRKIPEKDQRVGIFVDVQNIFYAAKQFNARLDFEKLLTASVGQRRLIRAIAYVVQSPEVDQSGFISMLQQKGYEVRQKDLRLRSDGSSKGDWDMGMALDIVDLVDKLDVVVLVTGDGDFVSLLNLVKTIGPRVELISFLHNTARDLIRTSDLHIPIEEPLLMRPNDNGANAQNTINTKAAPSRNTEESPAETQQE